MTTSREPAINLTFSDAVTVLMDALDVAPVARSAFDARIRHLQRLGLPARAPDQKMSRIPYGIPELAALATAFKLMSAFMLPVLAARYVTECWAELAPFTLAGARDVLPPEYLARRSVSSGTVAVFEGNALAELGHKARLDERYAGPLGRIVIADEAAVDVRNMARGSALVLDSRTYMPRLITRAVDLALATEADLASELDRLRFAGNRKVVSQR